MTARTFGRKGGIAAPAQRRAALIAHQPRSFEPIERQIAGDDEIAAKRAAFLAGERERAGGGAKPQLAAATETALRAFKAEVEFAGLPADRTLKTAYMLWFATGLAGGHRFYLRRPLTGAVQALLFLGCVGAVLAQYYPAFGGLLLSWLWMLADGFLIRRLYRTAAR
ncbi:MAG TPA: TM2 domain-containing protein [Allosphingosinicella sp.]|nr:TM2 domain-containing protein [Allosphingosinicella sp.]